MFNDISFNLPIFNYTIFSWIIQGWIPFWHRCLSICDLNCFHFQFSGCSCFIAFKSIRLNLSTWICYLFCFVFCFFNIFLLCLLLRFKRIPKYIIPLSPTHPFLLCYLIANTWLSMQVVVQGEPLTLWFDVRYLWLIAH